ncbi:MAG: ATP-dependent zinc metalloprotease FtsH [Candidatus Eisenbacteria bacterium]|uniref:ATP-dependent zinc metalloprotease FtsH n=1 Tax=Eiseniibacteriota bacterium TaxID=2212470 RepID=A0A948W614_UNCEI|nr:ATP-dependent zinc metalloprotease FtsH [Candidatus Eisenbacteria bacterium]
MTRSREPRKGRRPRPNPEGPNRPPVSFFSRTFRTFSIWIILFLIVAVVVNNLAGGDRDRQEISLSEFWAQVESGNIESIIAVEKELTGEFHSSITISANGRSRNVQHFKVYLLSEDPELPQKIWDKNPDVEIRAKPAGTPWFNILLSWWLPILILVGLWFFLIRQMQSGGSAALRFGKSKPKVLSESAPKTTFKDVAGADEAKQELQEIIEFLRDPKKFQRLGGRIPKGALLVGPPGTGKTLLARAVAGEAGVPFLTISGSEFVEMFVGVGASRVRDLFEQGKKNAPCIIFIDEMDAVGRQRGAGLGGGHDEREQTLNQLLVEMDGFDSNEGVILLSATNRPDVLDPALLRPGRFDRQIVVDRPDVRGREGILKVHTKNKPLGDDVKLKTLAQSTPGLAGADLANMVNEAALLAARRDHTEISMRDFEDAKDKVMMGAERKSLLLSEEDKKITAYHEIGHALVGWLLPNTDPIHKVTVIPRGRALGQTHFVPEGDRHTLNKDYLLESMAAMMGGRAAETLVFDRLTTGAAHDIQNATGLARKMVCEWGMSESLGPIQFGKKEELIFLGREISQHKDFSEKTAEAIDDAVRGLVVNAYEQAMDLLRKNEDALHRLAAALLDREVLDAEDIAVVMDGKELGPKEEEDDAGENAAAKAEKRTAPASKSTNSEKTPPPAWDEEPGEKPFPPEKSSQDGEPPVPKDS